MTALYVIALTDESVTPPRIAGGRLEIVPVGGLYAVVQKIAERPAPSEDLLRRQHDVVVELARRSNAMLPARFGSFLPRKDLEEIVSARSAELRRALDLVRGREQMTLRFPPGADVEPASRAAPARPTSGAQYLRARHAATVVQVSKPVRELVAAVRPWVKAERIETGDRGQATVYHLIARGQSAEYRDALDTARLSSPSVLYHVSGPWPPFAFAPELLS